MVINYLSNRGDFMIASNVKQIMEKKKKTICGLANELQISDRTIKRARGPLISQCQLGTLEKIANALGVRLHDLYRVEKEAN